MAALLVSSPRLYAARQLGNASRLGLKSRTLSPAVGVARPSSLNRLPVQAILQPQRPPPTPTPLDDQVGGRHAALNRLAKPLLGCLALALAACVLPAAAQAASAAAPAAAGSSSSGMVGLLKAALSFILHLDVHLGDIIAQYGRTTYAILFAIVFCETGLVVMPFLPGDSLLFATGALAALGKLNIWVLLAVYIVAATVGDAVNYAMGSWLGTKAISSGLVKEEYIKKTEEFYAKYGGKTVILSRFVPIVRTMAPFVAGIGSMQYSQFAMYNVVGALLWTGICTGAGWAFGNVPAVHENFSLVVLGIVVVSVLPVVFEIWAAKRSGGHGESGSADAAGKPKLA